MPSSSPLPSRHPQNTRPTPTSITSEEVAEVGAHRQCLRSEKLFLILDVATKRDVATGDAASNFAHLVVLRQVLLWSRCERPEVLVVRTVTLRPRRQTLGRSVDCYTEWTNVFYKLTFYNKLFLPPSHPPAWEGWRLAGDGKWKNRTRSICLDSGLEKNHTHSQAHIAVFQMVFFSYSFTRLLWGAGIRSRKGPFSHNVLF